MLPMCGNTFVVIKITPMRTSNSINSTDRLYLTVMTRRKTVASFSISGVNSMNEIFRYVLNNTHGQKGIVTLYLRNGSQGWVQQHTMVINRQPSLPKEVRACNSMAYPSLFECGSFES